MQLPWGFVGFIVTKKNIEHGIEHDVDSAYEDSIH